MKTKLFFAILCLCMTTLAFAQTKPAKTSSAAKPVVQQKTSVSKSSATTVRQPMKSTNAGKAQNPKPQTQTPLEKQPGKLTQKSGESAPKATKAENPKPGKAETGCCCYDQDRTEQYYWCPKGKEECTTSGGKVVGDEFCRDR